MQLLVVKFVACFVLLGLVGAGNGGENARNGQKGITLHLYRRDYKTAGPEISQNENQITFKKLDPRLPVKVLIHGWKGHVQSTVFTLLVEGFLSARDQNVITVDWKEMGSKSLYPSARAKVPEIAQHVATFLDNLRRQRNIRLEDIHVVGHSLGAHIAGIAGYLVKTGKIGRITGSDPAGPLFSKNDVRGRLSAESALFVDVIHTSSNLLGMSLPLGHVDFYPNGPHMFQPGCGVDIKGQCSHRRSYAYLAESLKRPNAFLAVPCSSWEDFQRKKCNSKAAISMGENVPRNTRGTYYLKTNGHAPFGTGRIWD